jgi:excisionase family DNA binding protein
VIDPMIISVDRERAAEITGLPRGVIETAYKTGDLAHVRIGRRVVIPVKALSEWIDSMTVEGGGRP